MSKPQWIRASQEDYERLADAHSVALREMEQLRAALAAAEAKLEQQGYEYTKALAETELALGADVHALEAKLADERRHADALVERVREVLEYDALHGGDPGWEASLQDEHKTGPNNPHTLASHLAAHAARRAAEVSNG